MKKKYLALIIIGMSLLLVACKGDLNDNGEIVETLADFPQYGSIEHLSDSATEVVRVRVLDKRVEWLDFSEWVPSENELAETGGEPVELELIYTIYRLEVLEVFDGDVEVGNIIEVKEIGGQIDDTEFVNLDEVPIHIGDDLVLFLESFENMPASLLNANQSAYRFPSRNRSLSFELESISPENDLTLTLGDLMDMSEND